MNQYWIDALSPLVFRSGKPFGAQSDTEDIIFPLPSAAAGLIRTQYMLQNNFMLNYRPDQESRAVLDNEKAEELKSIALRGFFLASQNQEKIKILVPKPTDAMYLKNKVTGQTELVRLVPMPSENTQTSGCDLPHEGLTPVSLLSDIKGKPQSGANYWEQEDFEKWQLGTSLSFEEVEQNGIKSLPLETRTHVALNDETLTSDDGKLFQTASYDFAPTRKAHHQGWNTEQCGFIIASEQHICDDIVRFGGEGRLSRLQKLKEKTVLPSEKLPSAESVFAAKGLKLTLLTPAIFSQGWLPGWIDTKTLEGTLPHTSITVRLRATALDRWQPVSGWDLHRHKPKAMRKAVPAGSVYWFEYLGGDLHTLTNIAHHALSDDQQDCQDGFGIVALSAWKAS